jgi:uncharacterized protein (DUF58 family)
MTAAANWLPEMVDPRRVAAVEDIELVARWVVEGFLHGLHRSPYVGFSVDFSSHREYAPGDDLRHLNWKIWGRHDKLYVKQYDAETNVDLHLLLDVSGSMLAGDAESPKLRYACLLAATLAHLAARQRDAVGLTLFADRVIEHHRARATSDHRLALFAALSRQRAHPRADSIRVLHEAAELMPRRGLVALISDLYFDADELLGALDHFRHFGHDVLVFQVLDPLERLMNVEGLVRFVDQETGEVVETVAHEIRDSFAAAVTAWQARLAADCLARDIDLVPLTTHEPLDRALWDFLVKRARMY